MTFIQYVHLWIAGMPVIFFLLALCRRNDAPVELALAIGVSVTWPISCFFIVFFIVIGLFYSKIYEPLADWWRDKLPKRNYP